MDEALEVVEALADTGVEGVVVTLLRVVGVLLVLAGIGLWLLTDVGFVVPAGLVVAGVLLLVVPGLLFELVGG